MNFRFKQYTSISIWASVLAFSTVAKATDSLPIEIYQKAEQQLGKYTEKLVTGNIDYPAWKNDQQLYYRSNTDKGIRYFIVDTDTKKKKLAFNHQKLASALSIATNSDIDGEKFPFSRIEITNKNELVVNIEEQSYQCDLRQYICKENSQAIQANEHASPDGKQAVFIREHNLWLRTIETNIETQLTTDGIQDFGYATNNAGWIRGKKPVVKWSPDSTKLTTFRHDGRNVGEMGIVSTAVGHPKIDVWKYPLPGDKDIFKIHRVVIDINNKSVTKLDMLADDHRSTITDHVSDRNGNFLDIDWSSDSKHFAFVSSSRDHKKATLKIADANTGKVRTILTETQENFFESGVSDISWQYIDKTEEIIWFSQRSNWGHLYLIDANSGQIKNRITQGDWTVLELLNVDQNSGKLLFTGAGREGGDPYFHYFYSINKDGSNLTLLTPEKMHHRVTLNGDATFFLDRVSTPNEQETSFIRSTSKKSGFIVEQMDISKLNESGWQAPTPFVVKDRNGEHDIHGLLYKPSDFDASKHYPVVNYLYPGPQVGSIRGRHFRASRGDNQAIAELGFIVIEIDALGTPGRSKSFHDFYYGNMGDSGIPDQVTAIKQLANKHAWIDADRVGIWGHSGGGFASTRALLTFPDFYSVAVSQAGNHDNRNYADEWGEKYHGLLENNEDGSTNYDSQANQLSVDSLKGKLLIAHGTTDTNVPPYNTLVVVEALIEANKDFDMLMLPNRGHGFAREPYMMRKRWDYFVTHLLGGTPPKEFLFKP